ncbi:hypothetical protein EGT29_21310 [Pigmentiphaga sp. H8]|uniref:hypothetical protein n=1 Tax=Pigmentiphaga sp. H8 TaxID=2488560 RepID=UPI000F5B17B1|nr:hypothetical protein [Pigmentiphaga sp. H8]AZG10201.1 hypothetical protein EGT29_21310 [Pigmentiphaga sp. H8]
MIKFDPSMLSDDAADQYTWNWMKVRTEPLSAEDYLSFATEDLVDGKTPRNLINSLSNAKKALHLRLEDLCLGFGAKDLKNLKAFPALINYARECGFVAPRVLDRLNTQRNAVEHDYILPIEADVETLVDIVHLFIAATDRWVSRRPCEVGIYNVKIINDSSEFDLNQLAFDWPQGTASLVFGKSKKSGNELTETIEYQSPSPEFFQCVRFALRNSD